MQTAAIYGKEWTFKDSDPFKSEFQNQIRILEYKLYSETLIFLIKNEAPVQVGFLHHINTRVSQI